MKQKNTTKENRLHQLDKLHRKKPNAKTKKTHQGKRKQHHDHAHPSDRRALLGKASAPKGASSGDASANASAKSSAVASAGAMFSSIHDGVTALVADKMKLGGQGQTSSCAKTPGGCGSRGTKTVEVLVDAMVETHPQRPRLLQEVYAAKVLDRTLLFDNPEATVSLAKAKKRALKHKLANCKTVQQKRRGKQVFDQNVGKSADKPLRFEALARLHELWLEYVHKVLDSKAGASARVEALPSLDLCGALIKVHASRVAGFVDVHGLVVDVTAKAVKVISKDDRLYTIPLETSDFMVDAGRFSYAIDGKEVAKRKVFAT